MTTKTRATKEYAYCPSWGTSPNTRRFRLSRDIVQSAIKVYPKGKLGRMQSVESQILGEATHTIY